MYGRPTPNPSRTREGSETCVAAGGVSRSGVGNPSASFASDTIALMQMPNANGGRHRCRPPLPPPSGVFLRQTVPCVRKRAIRGAKPLGRCRGDACAYLRQLTLPASRPDPAGGAGATLVPAAGLAAMGGRFSFVSGHRSLGSSRERRAVGRTPAGLKDRRCVPLSPGRTFRAGWRHSPCRAIRPAGVFVALALPICPVALPRFAGHG